MKAPMLGALTAALIIAAETVGFAIARPIGTEGLKAAQRITPPPSALTVAWIGTSISWAEPEAIEAGLRECGFTDIHMNVRPGRSLVNEATVFGAIQSGYQAIDLLEATVDPDVWILEQGLNDIHMGYLTNADQMTLAIVGALWRTDMSDHVVWINTWSSDSKFEDVHALFGQVLAQRDEITVVDWASVAPTLPNVVADGIHGGFQDIKVMADMACDGLKNRY
jgi:hypothetical protein